jgi:hypothetical protein
MNPGDPTPRTDPDSTPSRHTIAPPPNIARHPDGALPHSRADSGPHPAAPPTRPRPRLPAARGPHRPRAVLTVRQALQIYLYRPGAAAAAFAAVPEPALRGDSPAVAARYGVSPKTVRDLWARRRSGGRKCSPGL